MPALDNFDQYLYLEVTESAANTFTEEEYPVPIELPTGGTKAKVLELTRLIIERDDPEVVTASTVEYTIQLTTDSKGGPIGLDDNDLIFKDGYKVCNLASAAGETTIVFDPVIEISLLNEKGVGMIYPFQQIYFGIKSTNATNAHVAKARLYFNWKNISAAELLQYLNP